MNTYIIFLVATLGEVADGHRLDHVVDFLLDVLFVKLSLHLIAGVVVSGPRRTLRNIHFE